MSFFKPTIWKVVIAIVLLWLNYLSVKILAGLFCSPLTNLSITDFSEAKAAIPSYCFLLLQADSQLVGLLQIFILLVFSYVTSCLIIFVLTKTFFKPSWGKILIPLLLTLSIDLFVITYIQFFNSDISQILLLFHLSLIIFLIFYFIACGSIFFISKFKKQEKRK